MTDRIGFAPKGVTAPQITEEQETKAEELAEENREISITGVDLEAEKRDLAARESLKGLPSQASGFTISGGGFPDAASRAAKAAAKSRAGRTNAPAPRGSRPRPSSAFAKGSDSKFAKSSRITKPASDASAGGGGGGSVYGSSAFIIAKSSNLYDPTTVVPLPEFEGTALVAGDPGPFVMAEEADVQNWTMPSEMNPDVSGTTWRIRWIVGAGVRSGTSGWGIITSNWFGAGSSAIYITSGDNLRIVYGGGNTHDIPGFVLPSEGDVVDIGFDDGRKFTCRTNGGTAEKETGTTGVNGWSGYTELRMTAGHASDTTVNGICLGTFYPPRTLADWWTV